MTGSDRLLAKSTGQPDERVAAERKRASDLVTALCDEVLATRDRLKDRPEVRRTLEQVAQKLVALATSIRSGEDATGLEERIRQLDPRRE